MKFFETKGFKTLQAEWYRKLRDSGFDDIEYAEGTSILKGVNSALMASRAHPELIQEYYRRATHFVKLVKKPRHKTVWRLHADGQKNKEIARVTGYHPVYVSEIICKYRKMMLDEVAWDAE